MPICLMVPDLISYATQLWRAAEVLPLMWHFLLLKIIGFPPPHLSLSLPLPLLYTHTFCPCSLWTCSVNRPLAMQCWCRVPVLSGGFSGSFSAERAQVVSEKRIWPAQAVCWGALFQHGSGVVLQVGVAPASEWERWDLWERWWSPPGLCGSTSVSAWPGIRKEPLWPTGSWLLSTLSGTADNQQKETPDDYSASADDGC